MVQLKYIYIYTENELFEKAIPKKQKKWDFKKNYTMKKVWFQNAMPWAISSVSLTKNFTICDLTMVVILFPFYQDDNDNTIKEKNK